jgi:glycine/D-amino acid oxidase-like deaminating enzyme
MKLRSGQSPWSIASGSRLTRPDFDQDSKWDVLVVASGITGTLVAFHLAERGAKVVVDDRRSVAAGSTRVNRYPWRPRRYSPIHHEAAARR